VVLHISLICTCAVKKLVRLKCGFFFTQCWKRSSICILPCFSNTILTAYRSGTRVLRLRPYYPSKGFKSFLLIHSGKSFILETRVIIQWTLQSKWNLKSDSLTKQPISMFEYFIRLVGILGSKGLKSSLSTYNIYQKLLMCFSCIGMMLIGYGGYTVTILIAKILKWSYHRFILITFGFGFGLLKMVRVQRKKLLRLQKLHAFYKFVRKWRIINVTVMCHFMMHSVHKHALTLMKIACNF
jgi:hypothetical protein